MKTFVFEKDKNDNRFTLLSLTDRTFRVFARVPFLNLVSIFLFLSTGLRNILLRRRIALGEALSNGY